MNANTATSLALDTNDLQVLSELDDAPLASAGRSCAATAAFLASEKAGAITGTFVNVTSGTFPSYIG